jgi:hypothetical protein
MQNFPLVESAMSLAGSNGRSPSQARGSHNGSSACSANPCNYRDFCGRHSHWVRRTIERRDCRGGAMLQIMEMGNEALR